MRLVSACLLGLRCRYDGGSNERLQVVALLDHETLIPVCPEQLGGLPTPRPASEIVRGRVMTPSGEDQTGAYQRGAEETVALARRLGVTEAILKQRSPSCGCGQLYDGSFSGRVVEGNGITTALLISHGIRVISEEEV
ncbi:MAG: DUF523 domain-containing protein [bacterium]